MIAENFYTMGPMTPSRINDFIMESNRLELISDSDSLAYINQVSAFMMMVERSLYSNFPYMVDLRELHAALMAGEDGAGQLRTGNVVVGASNPPPPALIRAHLASWLQYGLETLTNGGIGFREALDLHYWFEHVHPWGDGNGRLGRLVTAWSLWQSTGSLVVFQSAKREEYHDAIRAWGLENCGRLGLPLPVKA